MNIQKDNEIKKNMTKY